MTYPFEPIRIDQKFNNPNSYGPGLNHEGIDASVEGTSGNTDCGYELKAIKSGVCVHTSTSNKNYGNLVVIECRTDRGMFWVRYCHCQEFRVGVGDVVREGQVVATMGSTGNSTACHLHLDVLKAKPTHWRYYTQKVTDWFINPINFIEEYMPILDDPETIEKIKEDIIRLEAEIVQERQRTTDARNDRSAMLEALNLHPNTGREKAVEAIQALLHKEKELELAKLDAKQAKENHIKKVETLERTILQAEKVIKELRDSLDEYEKGPISFHLRKIFNKLVEKYNER